MIKLLVALLVASILGVLAFVAFGAPAVRGQCLYGSDGEVAGKASCLPRPVPTAAERTAATDGTALTAALASFKDSGDADDPLVGIGIDRWGETTFALDTGARFLGRKRQRHVTYDASGGRVSRLDPDRRGYVLPVGQGRFSAAAVDPAALAKVVGRVRAAKGSATLTEAVYGELGLAKGMGWRLTFDGAGLLFTDAKGGKPCLAIPGARLDGFGPCAFARAPKTPKPKLPSIPKVPGLPEGGSAESVQDCVAKAGTDVTKLQRCVSGG